MTNARILTIYRPPSLNNIDGANPETAYAAALSVPIVSGEITMSAFGADWSQAASLNDAIGAQPALLVENFSTTSGRLVTNTNGGAAHPAFALVDYWQVNGKTTTGAQKLGACLFLTNGDWGAGAKGGRFTIQVADATGTDRNAVTFVDDHFRVYGNNGLSYGIIDGQNGGEAYFWIGGDLTGGQTTTSKIKLSSSAAAAAETEIVQYPTINGACQFIHRGTGALQFVNSNNAPFDWYVNGAQKFYCNADTLTSIVPIIAPALELTGSAPLLKLTEPDGGIDAKYTWLYSDGGFTYIAFLNDAGSFTGKNIRFSRTGSVSPSLYSVATLPIGQTGDMIYVTNMRVLTSGGALQGAGAGTGGLATHNGTNWQVAGTNITAQA